MDLDGTGCQGLSNYQTRSLLPLTDPKQGPLRPLIDPFGFYKPSYDCGKITH
jgi:hypothetical protein